MKRFLLSIALLTAITSCIAQDTDKPVFFPKLFGLNKSCSVGLIGATMDNFSYGAMGINATFYGFYADFMFWPTKHGNSLPLDKWEDHRQMAFHAGYQIPFHYYDGGSIRLIPLLGYAKIEEGITDGSNYYLGDGGIVNSFTATNKKSGLDYGAALAFSNADKKIGRYNFYLGYTRYTAWIGLAVEFDLRNLK